MTRFASRLTLGERIFNAVNIMIMLVVVIATLYPFLNVLAIALNESSDTVKGGLGILPRKPTLDNFATILSFGSLGAAMVNSALRTVIGAVVGVCASSMLAYALSRKDFQGRRFISLFLAVTMYVSGGLIPVFLLVRDLHLLNSFCVYILPGMVGAFNVFMIRSFMDALPAEMSESARMDGASDWTIFARVVMPLCKPVLATIALFIAVGQWNSWFDCYLYNGSSPELTVLQFELMKILQSTEQGRDAMRNPHILDSVQKVSPDSLKMAITIVAILPILVVYPLVQRHFVSGVTIGAVKS